MLIDLHQKGVSIDPIIVLYKLLKNRKSSKDFVDFEVHKYVKTISKYTMVDFIVETHCNIIRGCSVRRTVLDIANNITRLAIDKSVYLETLIDDVQNRVNSMGISYKSKNSSDYDVVDIAKTINYDIQNRNFTENDFIESGFVGLDKIIKGFKKSALVIIGARPGVGKAAFALNIANNLCLKSGLVVLDFFYA